MPVTHRRPLLRVALGGLVALALLAPGVVSAKSYDHPLIEQTIRLLPDGSAEVEDVRTFRFDGAYSWADLRLKGEGQYGQYDVQYEGVTDADTGEVLEHEASREGDEAVLRWHFNAEDSTRRFRLRYRIGGAVQRFEDVAQFYWKAVEDQHAPIDELRVTIIPPGPSPALFKVFVHSQAAPGALIFAEDFRQAVVTQSGIPGTSFVELRALLDPALFPALPVRTDERYEGLLADETRQASATLQQGWLGVLRGGIFGLMVLGLIAGYLWCYWRFGREPAVSYEAIYEREPPTALPPAVVPAILTQGGVAEGQMPKAFVATLLEAGRLGYLAFEEGVSDGLLGTGLFSHPTMTLRLTPKGEALLGDVEVEHGRGERALESFEVAVLKVVFQEAGDGRQATSEEIKEWGKEFVGKKSRFLLFVEPWGTELRGWFERQHFTLDDPRSEKAKRWYLGAAFLAAGLFLFFPGIARFAGIALCLLLGFLAYRALSRRTPEAALEARRWEAFRRYMTDFSALNEAGPELLVLWEQYLVFAAALGVADKLLENVRLVAEERHQALYAPGWYHPAATSDGAAFAGGVGLGAMESFTGSLQNFANLSSALSTESPSGGGFSGGGGGGGGGGSSGAG